MNTEFERGLNNNYMIINSADEKYMKDEIIENYQEDYQMKMLSINGIEGFLLLKLRCYNGIAEFCYDISLKQKMSDWFKVKKVNKHMLGCILESLCDALENAEDYMLDINHIILKPEYVFVDSENYSLHLCYYPFYEEDILMSGQEFLQYLLEIMDYNDKEAVEAGYEVFRMCMKDGFRTDIIRDCMSGLKAEVVSQQALEWNRVMPVNIMKEEIEEECEKSIIPQISKTVREKICVIAIVTEIVLSVVLIPQFSKSMTLILIYIILSVVLVGAVLIFGTFYKRLELLTRLINVKGYISYTDKGDEYIYEENYDDEHEDKKMVQEETVLLAYTGKGERFRRLHYIGTRQQEDIILTNYPFSIGKSEEVNDYCLSYPFVSRVHFRIEKDNETYYIIDANSRNGLLLNGESINATETKELKTGDRVELGDLVFLFQ